MLKQLPPPQNKIYGEATQQNPLRWVIYAKETDGEFSPQSGILKCKDFFNEVVGWYYGHKCTVYSFSTLGDFHVNEEGVYIKLSNCTPQLWGNIERVIQPLLREQLGCELTLLDQEGGELFILFPRKVWETTYYISKLTLWIRSANFPVEFNSYEELQKSTEPLIDKCSSVIKLEAPFNEYWWYASPEIHSKNQPLGLSVSLIHSNGFMSWQYAMSKGVPNAL